MRKALFILLLFPLASLAITEAEFNVLCTNVSHSIESAAYYVNYLSDELELHRQNATVQLESYAQNAASPNATDYQLVG